MRAAFVLLVVAAVAAVGWWLLGRPAGKASPGPSVDDPAPIAGAPDPAEAAGPSSPTLPVAREKPVAPTPPPRRTPIPAREGTGDLVVVLEPPEGAAAPTDVKVDLEPIGSALSSYPLATRREDGTWRYGAIPVGRYRVWVLSPGWRDASAETTVESGAEARAKVALVAGAGARFKVSSWVSETPPAFKLSVLDARRRPVAATFHTSATRVRVPAGKELGGVSEGSLIGLKPGVYTLLAKSDEGETDEATFEAKLGEEPPTLELKLKR